MIDNKKINKRSVATFYLDDDFYGIDLGYVQEFIEVLPYNEIPGNELPIIGMANLRGQIVTIFDLKFKLYKKVSETHKRYVVIRNKRSIKKVESDISLKSTSREPIALSVTKRGKILELNPAVFKSAPPQDNAEESEFIESVVELDDNLLKILNLQYVIGRADDEDED